jgi:hypothetical protein
MHRRIMLIAMLAALASAGAAMAAENAVVGLWQVVSDSPGGEQYQWKLEIKEEDGKLSGSLSGGPGQFPLLEPKFEDGTLTFKVTIEEQTYAIQMKVTGAKIEGTWKGPSSQGTMKGSKQS